MYRTYYAYCPKALKWEILHFFYRNPYFHLIKTKFFIDYRTISFNNFFLSVYITTTVGKLFDILSYS